MPIDGWHLCLDKLQHPDDQQDARLALARELVPLADQILCAKMTLREKVKAREDAEAAYKTACDEEAAAQSRLLTLQTAYDNRVKAGVIAP
jgi:hypothetical protein